MIKGHGKWERKWVKDPFSIQSFVGKFENSLKNFKSQLVFNSQNCLLKYSKNCKFVIDFLNYNFLINFECEKRVNFLFSNVKITPPLLPIPSQP